MWSAWSVWVEWEGHEEPCGIPVHGGPRDSTDPWGKLSRKDYLYRFDRETDVAEPMTKMEAVRRALDELGLTAPTAALQEFVKMRFGLDMTPGHVKSYKGKIRKQAAAKGKPAPPKPAVQKAA